MSTYVIDGTALADGRVVVATGDLTRLKVDAIVNAANSSLMGGGGVDGAIHRAGGSAILHECQAIRRDRYPDGLPTGQAVLTTAGNLPCHYVIHTVGPVWHGGHSDEDQLLASAYRSSLECAAQNEVQTIAFPAISTGVYGFPKERAAVIVSETLGEYVASNQLPTTIYLVFFSQADADTYLRATGCL